MRNHKSNNGQNVLLLVDFQEGFLGAETKHLRAPVATLVRDPFFSLVIATRFINLKTGLWTSILNWSGLQTAEEQQLGVTLPQGSRIIDKVTYGIPNEELVRLIPTFEDKQVFVAGIETDVCVAVIAASLFDLGVAPVVLSNYTGTNRGKDHQCHSLITLCRIIGKGRVVPDISAWTERSEKLNIQSTKGI